MEPGGAVARSLGEIAEEVAQERGLEPAHEGNVPAKRGISYLKPRHYEIARRFALGQTAVQISQALGISQQQLSIILHSDLFKAQLSRLQERRDDSVYDVRSQIAEATPDALDEVIRIMYTSRSENTRLKAAESILDRGGFNPTAKSEINIKGHINTSNLSADDLVQLVKERYKRMQEAAQEEEFLVEEGAAIEVEGSVSINDEEEQRGMNTSGD